MRDDDDHDTIDMKTRGAKHGETGKRYGRRRDDDRYRRRVNRMSVKLAIIQLEEIHMWMCSTAQPQRSTARTRVSSHSGAQCEWTVMNTQYRVRNQLKLYMCIYIYIYSIYKYSAQAALCFTCSLVYCMRICVADCGGEIVYPSCAICRGEIPSVRRMRIPLNCIEHTHTTHSTGAECAMYMVVVAVGVFVVCAARC